MPLANVREAAVVEGIDVYGIRSLREVFEFLRGGEGAPKLEPTRRNVKELFAAHPPEHEADRVGHG